jgi:hypothetical protein
VRSQRIPRFEADPGEIVGLLEEAKPSRSFWDLVNLSC